MPKPTATKAAANPNVSQLRGEIADSIAKCETLISECREKLASSKGSAPLK